MEQPLEMSRSQFGEAVAEAAVIAADLVARKRGARAAALAAGAAFLASMAVGIPVTTVLVHEASDGAHRDALANCQVIEKARPQANARVLFQQALFEIALDRAPRYSQAVRTTEVANLNRILALAPKVAPGVPIPSHIDRLADLADVTQFYPLINCREQVRA